MRLSVFVTISRPPPPLPQGLRRLCHPARSGEAGAAQAEATSGGRSTVLQARLHKLPCPRGDTPAADHDGGGNGGARQGRGEKDHPPAAADLPDRHHRCLLPREQQHRPAGNGR
jgi:hypothetical protein